MDWLKQIPVNQEPLTRDNGALLAYVTLLVAEEMRADGMPDIARCMEKAAARLVAESGRLPAGVYIPAALLAEVRAMVIEAARQGAESGMAALLKAMPEN